MMGLLSCVVYCDVYDVYLRVCHHYQYFHEVQLVQDHPVQQRDLFSKLARFSVVTNITTYSITLGS